MSGVSAHNERYISKFADGTSVSETYVRAIRHQTVLREPTAIQWCSVTMPVA